MSDFKISERQWHILSYAIDRDTIHGGMGASFEGHICKSMVKRGWLVQMPGKSWEHFQTYRVTDLGRTVERQLRAGRQALDAGEGEGGTE